MKKKIVSVLVLMIIVLSSVIIPRIYADNNEIVSIINTNVKAGEQAKIYLNLENISEYTLSKIMLTTDIYIEPKLDISKTNSIEAYTAFVAKDNQFIITQISNEINTLSVLYTIPKDIPNGTKIKLTVMTYGYRGTETELTEQYKKTFEIVVIGEEPNSNDNVILDTTVPNNTRK